MRMHSRARKVTDPQIIKIICILFILFGLVFMAIGIYMGVEATNTKDGRVYTTATITRIEEYYRNTTDGYELAHRTYVQFEVDGEQISTSLSGYELSHEVGKQLEIFYYPDNPYNAHDKNVDLTFAIVFPILGGIALIVGLVGMFKKPKQEYAYVASNGNSNDNF